MAKVIFSNFRVLSSLPQWCHKNKVKYLLSSNFFYLFILINLLIELALLSFYFLIYMFFCSTIQFLSKFKMCRIVVPTLLLSGQSDTLVPPRMMMELYQTCPAVLKRLLQFANGSHNETWKCPGYYQSISHFLHEVIN